MQKNKFVVTHIFKWDTWALLVEKMCYSTLRDIFYRHCKINSNDTFLFCYCEKNPVHLLLCTVEAKNHLKAKNISMIVKATN